MNCRQCKQPLHLCICEMLESKEESSLIQDAENEKKTQSINKIGRGFAKIFALSCAIINAYAFIASGLLTGVAAYIVAGVLFTAVYAINNKIFKNAVPENLNRIFGGPKLFKNIFTQPNGKPLSKKQKIALGIGFFLALGAGATFASLSYGSVLSFLGGISFLGAISAGFPPIGIILAITTFICMTSIMFNAIDSLIKIENLFKLSMNFIIQLISIDPSLPHNQNKNLLRIIVERIFTVILTVGLLGLGMLGLYMTMNACAPTLKALLLQIPNAAEAITQIMSSVICYGLAFVAQIPFVIKTSLLTIKHFIDKLITSSAPILAEPTQNQLSTESKIWKMTKIFFAWCGRVICALGNGFVAMQGASDVTTKVLANAGATFNNYASAANDPDVEIKEEDHEPIDLTTTQVIKQLSLGKPNNISTSKTTPQPSREESKIKPLPIKPKPSPELVQETWQVRRLESFTI